MPRMALPDPADLAPDIREAIGENPPNVTRLMAMASAPVYRSLGQLGGTLIASQNLPANLRELAILRVGYMSGSAYELFQHEALARHIGMSEAQIDAIRAGDGNAQALDQTERAVLAFVEDIVVNVGASDKTLAALRNHLDDSQVIDLIVVTGYYMTVCRLLETSGIEIEADPIDWAAFGQRQPS